MVNFSIVMNNINTCSGSCHYCSVATTLDYKFMGTNKNGIIDRLNKIDEQTYDSCRFDFNKLENTLDNDFVLLQEKKRLKQGEQLKIHFDLWGGDPVTNHLCTIEIVDFLRDWGNKNKYLIDISSSTNGLPFAREDIVNYYLENKIPVQISHDGIGQWMRTGDIDPMLDDPWHDNIKLLANNGIIQMINTVTNFYNGDIFANKKYWDSVWKDYELNPQIKSKIYIKLNHVYEGYYDLQALNKNGRFRDKCYKALENQPIGDIRHRNASDIITEDEELNFLLKHELDDYMRQWIQIAILLRNPKLQADINWRPYFSYLHAQSLRYNKLRDPSSQGGACRSFQLGKTNRNFVIDTTGRYCQCNLIDADNTVKNPDGWQPDYCKYCRYENQAECFGCGSEKKREDVCEYLYRWCSLLETVKLTLDPTLRDIKSV